MKLNGEGIVMMMMMKCGNCKRELEVERDIIMIVCLCGYTMEVNL